MNLITPDEVTEAEAVTPNSSLYLLQKNFKNSFQLYSF